MKLNPNLKLADKVLILVTVPIVFMLVFVGVLASLERRAEEEAWQERHARDIVSECNAMMHSCMDAGAALFLYQSSRRKAFLDRFDDLVESIPVQINTIKLLMREDGQQDKSLADLEKSANRAVELLHQSRKAITGVSSQDSDLTQQWTDSTAEVLTNLQAFVKKQRQRQRLASGDLQSRHMLDQSLIGGVLASIAVAIVLAIFFNRSTTRRLLVVVDDTRRLSRGEKLHPVSQGGDEIAHLHQVFHQMADDLAQADKRKNELLGVVSHDLRAPLTSVEGSLTLLEEGAMGPLTEKGHRTVRIAQASVTRLICLINDLLDIEKMKGGKIQLKRRQVVMEELFERACDTLKILAEQKSITLKFDETDAVADADPDRVIQILINLISNAIKFSPNQSSVTLSAQRTESGVIVNVADQGRGIPEEQRTKLFARFHQVDAADAKIGTGLGLSICKAFVEAHEGEIGVKPGDNVGTIFWFTLPDQKKTEVALSTS